ncbi:MAG: hypothetical protein JEZ07_00875 [Phycisphaerae bacterium]|nr:hypothetical protein [Phycisphaerae bacterium]
MQANRVTCQYLKNAQYEVKVPFVLELDIAGGDAMLDCDKVLRVLPGKRIVCSGQYAGQKVLAKVFLDADRHKVHFDREVNGLEKLKENNIFSPAIIQACESDGQSVLLTEFIAEGKGLDAVWQDYAGSDKIDFLMKLIKLIARMHDAGLKQDDLHLGNFLINQQDDIYCIDGGAIIADDGPLDEAGSIENIVLFFAQLNRQYDIFIPQVYQQYCWTRGGEISPCIASEIVTKVREIRSQIEKKYLKKVFRNCSQYVKKTSATDYLICARDYYDDNMKAFLADCDSYMDRGQCLKDGNSTTVGIVDVGGRKLVVKRYNMSSLIKIVRKQLPWPPSRIEVSWKNANMQCFAGILTPKPVAIYEKRFGPFKGSSYFITEYQPGDDCLFQMIDQKDRNVPWRDAMKTFMAGKTLEDLEPYWHGLLSNFIKLQKQFGYEQIIHGDLKATNFIDVDGQYSTIDLDALHRCMSWGKFRKEFNVECQRFLFNWRLWPEVKDMARVLQFEILAEFGDFRIEDVLKHKICDDGLKVWQLPGQYCFDGQFDIDLGNKALADAMRANGQPSEINAEILKQGVRRSIYRVEISGKSYVIKAFPLQRMKDKRRYQRYAYQEVVNNMKARRAGLDVPGCYVYFEKKKMNRVDSCGIVMEDLDGYVELTDLYQKDQNALLLAIPILVKLYQKGVNHIDISPSNLLFASDSNQDACKIIDWQYCSFVEPCNDGQLIMLASHFLKYAKLKGTEPLWGNWLKELHGQSGTVMPFEFFQNNVARLQNDKLAIKDRLNLDARAMGMG